MKAEFLKHFKKSYGVIQRVCDDIGIDRTTFYDWKKDDPQFTAAVQTAEIERNDSVEDALFALIANGDGACIRFYLGRRNPLYTQKVVNKVYTGERTLEDLLDEYQTADENVAGQQAVDRATVQDSEQARGTGAISVEHSAELLLEKKDSPKSDSEGSAEGTK